MDEVKTEITAVKTKWVVEQVTDFGYNSKQSKLRAVYSNEKNSEDNQFSSATPSGEVSMMVSNPATMDFFKPGKKYFAVWTECPED